MKNRHPALAAVLTALLAACTTPGAVPGPVAVVQYEPAAAPVDPATSLTGVKASSYRTAAIAAPTDRTKARLFIVGMGPGSPDLATIRALKTIQSADVIFCEDVMQRTYAKFLQGKDVRGSWQAVFKYKGKDYLDLRGDEAREFIRVVQNRGEKIAQQIRDLIAQGKTVAILEFGDPLIYGPIRHYMRFFRDDEFEVVPGMSALNAANALLKRETAMTSGSSTLTLVAPFGAGDRKDHLASVAALQSTIVIYMGLQRLPQIVDALAKHYSRSTPVAIVYWAGLPDRQKILRSTLNRIVDDTAKEDRNAIGLIYVGRFLGESFAGD